MTDQEKTAVVEAFYSARCRVEAYRKTLRFINQQKRHLEECERVAWQELVGLRKAYPELELSL